jgi:hypothetical protein
MRSHFKTLIYLAVLLSLAVLESTTLRADLATSFLHPPDSARPWVYWFWLNGNITRTGITADLEAMKRVGIGGVLIMEVDQGAPAGPIKFASPEWRDLFKFMLSEASRLGLQVNMTNDAGWCGSGGPWITPELSMQKVVWTETVVQGGHPFAGTLSRLGAVDNYYEDIALLAMPLPAAEDKKMADFSPTASTSTNDPQAGNLIDGNPATTVDLSFAKDKPAFVQVEFAKPFTARALTVAVGGSGGSWHGELQVSDDAKNFSSVAGDLNGEHTTIEFPTTTGRYFRVNFTSTDSTGSTKLNVAELNLSPGLQPADKISDLDGKASNVVEYPPPQPATFPDAPAGATTPRSSIIDLTAKMDKDGKVSWDAPPGKWLLLRFGHTTTGVENHPAPAGGLGLECDKFSKAAVAAHFQGLMAKLIADSPSLSGSAKTLVTTHIDSWEIGSQNWTPLMREEFQKRRGYDLIPFLPIFTGRVVESTAVTERFLWDLRQTVSDLVAQNYAGGMRDLAKQNGIKLSIEAYGGPTDDMTYGGRADEPMGEFWSWDRFGAENSVTEMTSTGHIYGKHIIGAESFTATDKEKWQGYPENIKDIGDWAFCEGINRFVFHRYAMQPWLNRAPGMSMGPWGLHYERTETWWEQSKPWHEYLARCQYLLRQGLFVADVCYLEPEGAPHQFAPPGNAWNGSRIRSGYNFDGCTPEVVLTRMSVKGGRLVLPDGMSYRALVLPPEDTMTLPLLRKVKELVDAGATVVASNRPQKAPGLTDYPKCDEEVQNLVKELWDSGKVITGKTIDQVFADKGLPHDFEATAPLRYTHRSTGNEDIYFVANPREFPITAKATFRVASKQPELWYPDSGRVEVAAFYQKTKESTAVPISLDSHGSVFVIFRGAAANPIVNITRDDIPLWQAMASHAVVINKALYGVLDDPTRTRDVTKKLQGLVDRGQLQIPVAQMATGDDPAPGIVKTLTVEYMVYGQQFKANGQDVDSIALNGDSSPVKTVHPIVINKALYGVLADPSRTRDVTKELQALADQGQVEIHVSDMAASGDPAFKTVKTLTVDYTADGQKFKTSGQDSESITLESSKGQVQSLEALVDLSRTGKGHYTLEAGQGGTYKMQSVTDAKISCVIPPLPKPLEITGPWRVSFEPGKGAPAEITMDQLGSWSDQSDPGVKYFSGAATYFKKVDISPEMLGKNRRLYLDLGTVKIMAEVTMNGKSCGTLWKTPFRVDITDAAKSGENILEVKVVNLWINRMIGDENLPALPERQADGTLSAWPKWLEEDKPDPTGRYSFSTWDLWKKNDPLKESGLIGPVILQCTARIDVTAAPGGSSD